jgi:hypothetical protein
MKTLRLLLAAAGVFALVPLRASDSAGPSARTEVVFEHPENFTDVKDGSNPSDQGRDAILADLRRHLIGRADSYLPEGYGLKVTFTDIDLAGDFEPWHGGPRADIRVIRDIYPPTLKFRFSVTDPSGKVVKEGAEDIRDIDFQARVVPFTSDPLRYEKEILDDWARSALGGLKRP